MPMKYCQRSVSDKCRCREQTADSLESGAVPLSSPLCSIALSDRAVDGRNGKDNNDRPHIIDRGEGTPDGNGKESPKETQDGTIDSADNTDTGTEE